MSHYDKNSKRNNLTKSISVVSLICSMMSLYSYCRYTAEADPGEVDWLASHPLWVSSVHNTNSLFEHSLLYSNHY